jgi:hypothetical protein
VAEHVPDVDADALAAALFCLDPTPAAVRTLPLHRIEVAANGGGAIGERLAARLEEPVPLLGSADFLKAFDGRVIPGRSS